MYVLMSSSVWRYQLFLRFITAPNRVIQIWIQVIIALVLQKELILIRDQHWIVFSLLIIAHEILNIIELTLLKFNYVFWYDMIHSYPLRWFIGTGCNEYAYNVDIKLIPFDICLIHKPTHFKWLKSFIKIYALSCCYIYNKRKKTRQ